MHVHIYKYNVYIIYKLGFQYFFVMNLNIDHICRH